MQKNDVIPLHKIEFVYVLEDKDDILPSIVECRALSKKELINIHNKYYDSSKSSNNLYVVKIVEISLLPPYKKYINFLSDEDIKNIYEKTINLSVIADNVLEKARDLILLSNEKSLKNDTWNCEYCKERGLQEHRACPYIDESKRDKTFSMYLAGKVFKSCPIYDLVENTQLLNACYECYRMIEKGLLPEDGGMLDQTTWFIELSRVVSNTIIEIQNKQLESKD